MGHRVRDSILFAAIILVPASLRAEDPDPQSNPANEFAERIWLLTNLVLDNHIEPPSRQEMILAGTRLVCVSEAPLRLIGLGRKVSDLSTREATVRFLQELHANLSLTKKSEESFIYGMLTVVPGSARLIEAESQKTQQDVAANRYVGIGIRLGIDNKTKLPQFADIIPGGPAWYAGARKGEVIANIDGVDIENESIAEVIERLRGPAGTSVAMTVMPADATQSRELTMTRGRIFVPTVEGVTQSPDGQWSHRIKDHPEVALLRLTNAGPSTLHELRRLDTELHDTHSIILDLRSVRHSHSIDNAHQAALVADAFLNEGIIGHLQTTKNTSVWTAQPGELFQDKRIAVLVGTRITADFALLAAALQDHKRAFVIGFSASPAADMSSIVPVTGTRQQLVLESGRLLRADRTPLRRPRHLVPSPPVQSSIVTFRTHVGAALRIVQDSVQSYGITPDIGVREPVNRKTDEIFDTAVKHFTGSLEESNG